MKRYMEHIIRGAEERTDSFLKRQVRLEGASDDGAIRGDVVEGKPTVYALTTAAAVYCCKESRYYHKEELLQAMNRAIDFIGRWQRPDGSLDFPTCNFHSAADTSFCFKRLIAAYRIWEMYEPDSENPGVAALKGKYRAVMKKALLMIRDGGFHTPNHRWAITAALMQGENLFGEEIPGLSERAKEYLAEGIDGNEDGEYAERSTGNYNAVVNNAMLAMYQESGDRAYLGYAVRNLHMMLRYIEPDGTIFTQNSTRQDQGRAVLPDKYFYQYLYAASLTDEEAGEYASYRPELARAAHQIILENMERGDQAPDVLHIIMRHPQMAAFVFEDAGYPESYRKFFKDAGVLRVREKDFGYTVLRGKPAFLYLKFGEVPVFVRIGESVGAHRYFLPEQMEVLPDGCRLRSEIATEYYQPFGEDQGTADWWKMDHTRREILKNSTLAVTVDVKELPDGISLTVKTEGLDRVPLRLQIGVPSGAVLDHAAFCQKTMPGGWLILREGTAQLRDRERVLEIGPGFGTHSFGGHYSGEEPNETGFTLYLNEYTPYERTVYIRELKNR